MAQSNNVFFYKILISKQNQQWNSTKFYIGAKKFSFLCNFKVWKNGAYSQVADTSMPWTVIS